MYWEALPGHLFAEPRDTKALCSVAYQPWSEVAYRHEALRLKAERALWRQNEDRDDPNNINPLKDSATDSSVQRRHVAEPTERTNDASFGTHGVTTSYWGSIRWRYSAWS